MTENEKLVSGLKKLNLQHKNRLKSWELDIECSLTGDDVSNAKGRINGYLNALADVAIIDREECRAIYRFYVSR